MSQICNICYSPCLFRFLNLGISQSILYFLKFFYNSKIWMIKNLKWTHHILLTSTIFSICYLYINEFNHFIHFFHNSLLLFIFLLIYVSKPFINKWLGRREYNFSQIDNKYTRMYVSEDSFELQFATLAGNSRSYKIINYETCTNMKDRT